MLPPQPSRIRFEDHPARSVKFVYAVEEIVDMRETTERKPTADGLVSSDTFDILNVYFRVDRTLSCLFPGRGA